jgi:hypothetical protein
MLYVSWEESVSSIFDPFNLHLYDVNHVLGLWLAFFARISNNMNLIESNFKTLPL